MSPKQRRQIIRDNILHTTTRTIATKCHVCRRTILRDIKIWRREGGFEELLLDEFTKSYPMIKKDYPDVAFNRLCYLLGKTMAYKVEAKTEIQKTVIERHEINLNVYSDDEKSILDKAARLLDSKVKGESTSLH